MEEKVFTPEEIEVFKAAKFLHCYCKDKDCNNCVFESYATVSCLLEEGCPEYWLVDKMPTTQDAPATPEVKNDNVNHPGHYTAGGVECIDAIEAATVNLTGIEGVCTGNVIKYVWRWKLKNGVEDLKKAAWYLHKLIKKLDPNWRASE